MIIFVGDELNGYWLNEVVSSIEEEVMMIPENPHIAQQINGILSISNCTYIVFDVSQYIDPSEEIAATTMKICQANNATPIILASGHLPNSEIIVSLIAQDIHYFIFDSEQGKIKEEFLKCVNGFYAANGIDLIENLKENIETVKERVKNSMLIGIGGIKNGIGTTTQCLQLVQYIQFCGYSAAYIEMNSTSYVQQLFASYDDCEIVDETLGHIRYKNIDLFDKQEKISDILQLGYNFYVYDYGVFTSPDFNKTSFLEKELKIFVVGCKPNELHFTQNVLRSLFYQDVCYIFNFTPEADKKELLEIMEEKAERTFFADWTVDPFTYSNSEIYSKILPLEVLRQEEPVKKSFFPFFNKKRGI